jgi:hypothetical protein
MKDGIEVTLTDRRKREEVRRPSLNRTRGSFYLFSGGWTSGQAGSELRRSGSVEVCRTILPWVRSKDGGNKDFHCDKGRAMSLFHGERLRLPRSSSNQSHDGHMAAATMILRIYAQVIRSPLLCKCGVSSGGSRFHPWL